MFHFLIYTMVLTAVAAQPQLEKLGWAGPLWSYAGVNIFAGRSGGWCGKTHCQIWPSGLFINLINDKKICFVLLTLCVKGGNVLRTLYLHNRNIIVQKLVQQTFQRTSMKFMFHPIVVETLNFTHYFTSSTCILLECKVMYLGIGT